MKSDLADFLARHKIRVEDSVVWGNLSLRITSYLGNEQPPLEYITSVRSLVFRDNSVLVVRNPDETHIIPGGRCEVGETLEETLRREVLKEAGWTIREISMLGFMHFHHLNPKPPGYKYPHPDFIQLIYTAQADQFMPEARRSGDYEIESDFHSVDAVKVFNLSSGQRLYLNAAKTKSGVCQVLSEKRSEVFQ
ncbi:MAG: NUDIX domain-containing protein [Candidatus Poribacteria bacterium]|nr:NUDIX domain-containing protein [Candidatus Poribacteria bacterium]